MMEGVDMFATQSPPNKQSIMGDTRPVTAGPRPTPSERGFSMPRPETRQGTGFPGDGSSRPTTSGRPITARPLSGIRGAPSTASRLISTAAMNRPSTRTGLATGIGFTTPINVVDRPITQQGISGMKTGSKGPQRQVQDKSYYMGLLRTKTGDLGGEIGRLKQETEVMKHEQSSFLTYDKRVKEVAQELTELQATLADYNQLVDLMNTDTEQSEVVEERKELKEENDEQMERLDGMFAKKQDVERLMRQFENEIEEERHMGESMLEAMQPALRERYVELRTINSAYLQRMEEMQQDIDTLLTRKKTLEDELSVSKVKQEAVQLYSTLNELEEKRNEIVSQNEHRGTPKEEREKLLLQVKEDNAEIAAMERQINEVQEEIGRSQEEYQQIEQEVDENQSERSQKYRELRKREESMQTFMDSFEESKREEMGRMDSLGNSNVQLLEKISKNIMLFGHLPSSRDYDAMRSDLNLKQGELQKSQYTEASLQSEHLNLQANLTKIEALESKVEKEKVELRHRLERMESEFEEYSDLEGLKVRMEEKRTALAKEKEQLEAKRKAVNHSLEEVAKEITTLKKQLAENETYNQLNNLEKKWAHIEQGNFALKEFIAQKRAESNFIPLKNIAMTLTTEYNKHLQDLFQSGGNIA